MNLILAAFLTLACGLIGALTLGRIHGVASRAEGKMARALAGIPDASDRDRWKEELRQTLLEFEGRPVKQFRESKQLVRAAERLVEVYAPSPAQCGLGSQATAEDSETQVTIEVGAAPLTRLNRGAVVQAMENLSYRERRILELRYGLGGEEEYGAEEVGEKFNVYADRIEQIESQALKKIHMLLEAQKLREVR